MTPGISSDRYCIVAQSFHWIIAALILANLMLGWRMVREAGLTKFEMIQVHKSIGITILLLSALRLVWRLLVPPPPLPITLKLYERVLAKGVHWSFYVLMIGLPLSGWAMVTVSPLKIPTLLYGVIPWPAIPGLATLPAESSKALGANFGTSHAIMTWIMWSLIALHLGAALKHRFVDRDQVLQRMLPWPQTSGEQR